MFAWGRRTETSFNGFINGESGLVRMFRTEYAKEYRHMKKMGYEVDDAFVRTYLQSR